MEVVIEPGNVLIVKAKKKLIPRSLKALRKQLQTLGIKLCIAEPWMEFAKTPPTPLNPITPIKTVTHRDAERSEAGQSPAPVAPVLQDLTTRLIEMSDRELQWQIERNMLEAHCNIAGIECPLPGNDCAYDTRPKFGTNSPRVEWQRTVRTKLLNSGYPIPYGGEYEAFHKMIFTLLRDERRDKTLQTAAKNAVNPPR